LVLGQGLLRGGRDACNLNAPGKSDRSGEGFLEHAIEAIYDVLGDRAIVLFVPLPASIRTPTQQSCATRWGESAVPYPHAAVRPVKSFNQI
jgi:hypothetical protein